MGENKTRHILNKAVDVITSMPLFTKLIYIYICRKKAGLIHKFYLCQEVGYLVGFTLVEVGCNRIGAVDRVGILTSQYVATCNPSKKQLPLSQSCPQEAVHGSKCLSN